MDVVKCKCGKTWWRDKVFAVEQQHVYAPPFPPEGLVVGEVYYCEDCFPY